MGFEWFQERIPKRHVCFQKEIGLRAENIISILGSHDQRYWGNLYDRVVSTKIFTLIMNKIEVFIRGPKAMREVTMGLNRFGFTKHHVVLIACFIS